MIKTKEIENKRNILHSYFSTISHSLLKMLEKGRPGINSLEIDKIISPRTEDKSDSFHIDSHQPLLQSVIIRPWNTERHSSLSQNRVTPMRSQGQDEFEPPPCSAIFIFSFPRKCAGNKLIIQGQRVSLPILENRVTVIDPKVLIISPLNHNRTFSIDSACS